MVWTESSEKTETWQFAHTKSWYCEGAAPFISTGVEIGCWRKIFAGFNFHVDLLLRDNPTQTCRSFLFPGLTSFVGKVSAQMGQKRWTLVWRVCH